MVPSSALVALGVHPRIVGLRQPPYVIDTAKYWLQALRLLAEPTMGSGDEDGLRHVLREPSPGAGLYLDRVAELCQRNIDSWYLELGDHQLKPRARYFAERFAPGPLLAAARELYDDAREVLLVRDPRHWLASTHRALAAQGRGGADGESPEAWVRRQGRALAELQAHWEAAGRQALVLRHEDLLLRPEPTLRALLRHLALDADDHAVSTLLAEMRVEMRASGAEPLAAARERRSWHEGISPALRAAIDEVTGEPARAFGYAGEGRGRSAVASGVPLRLGEH
jgi:sulfotransferase family protein